MSTTQYGPGGPLHGGAALAMSDGNGNAVVIKIPGDSTITVQTLRTAPDPTQVYSGTSANNASAAVDSVLVSDGVLP